MTTRDQLLSTYVDGETKREIERRADQADQSVSAYLADLIDRHIHQETIDEKNRELRAEQRIEELTATAADDVEKAADDIRQLVARSGCYAIASWELIKQEHGDLERQEALRIGAARLREDLQAAGINPDMVGVEGDRSDRQEDSNQQGAEGQGTDEDERFWMNPEDEDSQEEDTQATENEDNGESWKPWMNSDNSDD